MVVTEAPSVHRATEHICKLYQRFYTQTIYPKVIRNLYATPPSLFVPSLPPWYCVTSVLSVTPCAHYISLLIYPPYFGRTSYYPITMSWIPVTMSFIILLPCLEYPVTMSLITLYHVFHYSVTMSLITLSHAFHYPVTMSLITLSHVSHYPVTMSLITLSPSRNAKPQKKSWQVNYPKEPYSSKQLTRQLVYLCTPSTYKSPLKTFSNLSLSLLHERSRLSTCA